MFEYVELMLVNKNQNGMLYCSLQQILLNLHAVKISYLKNKCLYLSTKANKIMKSIIIEIIIINFPFNLINIYFILKKFSTNKL